MQAAGDGAGRDGRGGASPREYRTIDRASGRPNPSKRAERTELRTGSGTEHPTAGSPGIEFLGLDALLPHAGRCPTTGHVTLPGEGAASRRAAPEFCFRLSVEAESAAGAREPPPSGSPSRGSGNAARKSSAGGDGGPTNQRETCFPRGSGIGVVFPACEDGGLRGGRGRGRGEQEVPTERA